MKLKLAVFATVCLCNLLAPATATSFVAATAASKGFVIGGLAGAALSSGGETVVVQKPDHVQYIPAHSQIVLEHKPMTVVPLATIPSYSLTDRLARLWDGISDSIGGKIRAVGDFFRPPPRVVVVNVEPPPTTTHKPTTTKKPHPPVVLEIVGGAALEIPKHRYVSVPVIDDCDKK